MVSQYEDILIVLYRMFATVYLCNFCMNTFIILFFSSSPLVALDSQYISLPISLSLILSTIPFPHRGPFICFCSSLTRRYLLIAHACAMKHRHQRLGLAHLQARAAMALLRHTADVPVDLVWSWVETRNE
jgi:hypothetical protein